MNFTYSEIHEVAENHGVDHFKLVGIIDEIEGTKIVAGKAVEKTDTAITINPERYDSDIIQALAELGFIIEEEEQEIITFEINNYSSFIGQLIKLGFSETKAKKLIGLFQEKWFVAEDSSLEKHLREFGPLKIKYDGEKFEPIW